MKTFRKLLTNSLLFAENRMCNETGVEKQETPQAQPEGKFSPGQKVGGFDLPKGKEVKVKEGKAGNDGKPELIEGIALLADAEGNDQGQLVAVEREWRDVEGKVIFEKGEYLRRHEGDSYRENGEDVTDQFADYIKSKLIEKSKATADIEAKKAEAKARLEESKEKALEELPKTASEEAKKAVEEEYRITSGKIDEKEKETKGKIDNVSAEEKIEKTTADSLAAEFDVEMKKLTEEGGEGMDKEAEIKGKLKDPAQLEEWLKDAKNRAYMRTNIIENVDGKYIVNFKKLQTALSLSDKEYKIAERNLRIGNLLENSMIEKITSVKTKGKEMVAKYFYEGGERVKGVYTEKNKYIPIWNGTEISFGTENLEVVKAGDKDFEKKVAKAKASAPAEGGAKAKGAEPAPGTPAAAAAEGTAGAPQGVPTGSIAVPEATSQDAAKALGQVDQMPTIEGAQEEKVLPKAGAFLKELVLKGATELSIASYKNIDNWTKEQLGLAANATDEEVTAAREKTKEQARAVIDGLLERRVDDQKRGDSYKEFYEVIYGTDFKKVPQNPKVFAKYLDLTGKTILTEGVTGKTDKLTWGEGDVYFKAFIDNTKQSPLDGDINRATELTAEKKDFVKKIYTLAKASTNPVAKIWTLGLGDWLSENKDPEAQSEKKANFEKLRALVNDKATSPEDRIRFIETIKNTKEDELQAFGVGKEEFEKECKANLAQAYFDMGDFENQKLSPADLKDKSQKEFVEAFKDVSTIQSRAQLKGLLETPGVKPESFVKLAEEILKANFADNFWLVFEIYWALQMEEKVKVLAEQNKEFFAGKFNLARLEKDPKERQKALVETVNEQTFNAAPKDFQMTVMEILLKEGISPDIFSAFKDLAEANLDKNTEGGTLDEYQKSNNNAILRARLMQARLEIAQGLKDKGLPINDPELAKAVNISDQDAQKIAPNAKHEEIIYDPKSTITETKAYFDGLGDNASDADYALLKELHALYNGENARKFEEDFKYGSESQKIYAGLMYKLYDHTKDKKYLEGIDPSLLTEFGSVEFIESRGDSLYQQALQATDEAEKTRLFDGATAEYLNSASKEPDLKKKKQLLNMARVTIEQSGGDISILIAAYENMDDQEAQETAVDLYLQAGNYQAAAELLKKEGTKISLPFTIQKIDEFVAAGYASLAEDVCYRRDLYGQLIEQVYRKKKDMDVVLMGWLFSATPDKLSYDTIYGLLKDNDGRKEDSFGGYSFEGYEEAQKKEFCKAKRDTILREPDDTKKRILSKLGFARVEEFESFVSEEAAAEPQPEPTPEQPEATPEPTPEAPKDHTYVVEGNIVKIKTIGGKEYNITLDMPEGFKAKASEGEGDTYVAISDEFGREHIYLELNDEEKVKSDYVAGGDKDKYEMSYSDGTFKVTEKVLPETVGNPEEVGEREADVVDGDIATVEQPQTEQEASIPPETDETEPAAEPTPEAPKDHAYTVDGNEVEINTISNKKYKIMLNLPLGLRAEVFEGDDGDDYVNIVDEKNKGVIYIELDKATEKETHGFSSEEIRSKYDASYTVVNNSGVFTVTKKQPAPAEKPAEPEPPKQEPTSPAESGTPPSIEPKPEEEETDKALEDLG